MVCYTASDTSYNCIGRVGGLQEYNRLDLLEAQYCERPRPRLRGWGHPLVYGLIEEKEKTTSRDLYRTCMVCDQPRSN